jgi:signal transduction histidine kinase
VAVQRRRPVARGWLLWTSLGLGLFIAVLIFAGFWSQRRLAREIERDRAPLASHERLAAWTVENHLAEMERELVRLARLADLKDAVVAGGRQELQEQILPPLNRLGNSALRLSRITVYTPNGTVYLRAHAPQSYGDSAVSKRPLIAEAINARRIVKGMETERGVPYLWVATPMYQRGQFIGVLEMGSSLAPIVDTIRMVTGADVAVLLGTETPRTAVASDAALFKKLGPLLHRQGLAGKPARLVVAADGKTYAVSVIPLKDFSARSPASLAIVSDATAVSRVLRTSSLVTIATSFVGFVLAVALLRTLARKLDKFYWSLETHVEQLKALGRGGQAVSSSLDLRHVLDSIAHHAVNLSDSDACGILEFNVARQGFDVVAGYNLREAYISELQGRQVDPTASAITQAAEDGRAVQIPDIAAADDYPFRDLALEEGFRAQLAVPMGDENIIRGAVLYRRVPGRFDDQVVNLLTALAHQSRIAIDNARLFQEVQSQRIQVEDLSKNMQQLYRLSTAMQEPLSLKEQLTQVLESARQLVAVDRFCIWAVTPQSGRLTALAGAGFPEDEWKQFDGAEIPLVEAGALYKAYRERGALVFNEQNPVPPELRLKPLRSELTPISSESFLVIPMIARGRPVGLFTADNRLSRKPILPHTVELLQIFASHAAVAVDNARLFQEIEDRGRLLEIASKHKSQFLANMSHELRTPLNAVIGYTELLIGNAYGSVSDEMREVFGHIHSSGRHLLHLINDVLDLSKIEAGKLVLSVSDYSMKDVVGAVCTTLKPLAADKALALTVSIPPDLPPGRGDERRIVQVLINLVGNAIKFTDTGEVRVTVQTRDGGFSVSVSDTGPGIAPADQQKIFEEFQQADNSRIRAKGGTGLGLAISKRIVELHGGRLGVDSIPGQGSTFWFTLPVCVEPEMAVR